MANETLFRDEESDDQWISISDMMAGLMVIFLFIAISYMIHVKAEKEKIETIAVTYEKLNTDLYQDLENEFREDLSRWKADIDKENLSIRFKEPEVLFAQGEDTVRPAFKLILDDFFPRYIKILRQKKYLNDITEIRIEGHTSSEWISGFELESAYIKNMELSQGRTRRVLEYVLHLSPISEQMEVQDWVREHLTANGLSFSKLILDDSGVEDREASRRVEFRVRTNAEKRIVEIINRGKDI